MRLPLPLHLLCLPLFIFVWLLFLLFFPLVRFPLFFEFSFSLSSFIHLVLALYFYFSLPFFCLSRYACLSHSALSIPIFLSALSHLPKFSLFIFPSSYSPSSFLPSLPLSCLMRCYIKLPFTVNLKCILVSAVFGELMQLITNRWRAR